MPRTVDTVDVAGPLVLAYFATTQQEVDADPDEGEALSDFQWYLPSIEEELERHGVRLVASYRDSILVRYPARAELFLPRTQPVWIGYRFFSPGRKPVDLQGVHTDSDLLQEAKEYFRW